jgi:hypothetical protein
VVGQPPQVPLVVGQGEVGSQLHEKGATPVRSG